MRLIWSAIRTGWPIGHSAVQRAGGVRQHDGAAAGRRRRAHAVGDDRRVVALVEVDATEEHEHAAPGDLDRAHRRAVAGRRGRREAGEVGEGDVDAGAELGRGAAPARPEDDGDVVGGAARCASASSAAAAAARANGSGCAAGTAGQPMGGGCAPPDAPRAHRICAAVRDMTPPRPPARRHVSRQRYIVRRIGAGVAAVVVLLAGRVRRRQGHRPAQRRRRRAASPRAQVRTRRRRRQRLAADVDGARRTASSRRRPPSRAHRATDDAGADRTAGRAAVGRAPGQGARRRRQRRRHVRSVPQGAARRDRRGRDDRGLQGVVGPRPSRLLRLAGAPRRDAADRAAGHRRRHVRRQRRPGPVQRRRLEPDASGTTRCRTGTRGSPSTPTGPGR